MNLIKTATGTTNLKISKVEWEKIGNENGWTKKIAKRNKKAQKTYEMPEGTIIEGPHPSTFTTSKIEEIKGWLEQTYPKVSWTLDKVMEWINENFIGKPNPFEKPKDLLRNP